MFLILVAKGNFTWKMLYLSPSTYKLTFIVVLDKCTILFWDCLISVLFFRSSYFYSECTMRDIVNEVSFYCIIGGSVLDPSLPFISK